MATLTAIDAVLEEIGGAAAGREHTARLRDLLGREMAHGRAELGLARSGTEHEVVVVVAEGFALLPVDPALRADPGAVPERGRSLVGAVMSALAEAGSAPELQLGEDLGALVLAHDADAELAVIAIEDEVASIDRLRAMPLLIPAFALDPRDLRPPLEPPSTSAVPRPHDDPVPARRVARRILQRLSGMGKWGGYHTEFSHLGRGFAGNDRQLASVVGEALIAAGILLEKPSVGQRHVFLNPRRAAEVHKLVDDAEVPEGLTLPV